MVRKSAKMVYLENNVIYSFILSGLLFAQRIFRFYEKAEVTLLRSSLGHQVVIMQKELPPTLQETSMW